MQQVSAQPRLLSVLSTCYESAKLLAVREMRLRDTSRASQNEDLELRSFGETRTGIRQGKVLLKTLRQPIDSSELVRAACDLVLFAQGLEVNWRIDLGSVRGFGLILRGRFWVLGFHGWDRSGSMSCLRSLRRVTLGDRFQKVFLLFGQPLDSQNAFDAFRASRACHV